MTRIYPLCDLVYLEPIPCGLMPGSALMLRGESWSCFNLIRKSFLTPLGRPYPFGGVNGGKLGGVEGGAGGQKGGGTVVGM